MSFETNGMSAADVAAVVGNNRNDSFGLGGEGGYLLLFIIIMLCGGFSGGMWGNGMYGGGMWNMTAAPYFYNQATQNEVARGFDQSATTSALAGLTSTVTNGFAGVNQGLCNSTASITQAVNNGFAQAEIAANGRQMANMQQDFSAQTAMSQGFNNVGLQLCQASGENRLATANLGADIAREACATRTSDTQNTQLILNAINDGFRAMSDQRYQDKIDAKNDEIAQLRQENLYARGQASQIAQNTEIVNSIYSRLSQCPVGTTPVYGNQPIFTCPNSYSGCGCGNGFAN